MTTGDMPPAEVDVSPDRVGHLLGSQWPGWSGQEITRLAHGWDNILFRVGREHVARFPRRSVAVALLENEVRWLPGLARILPLPIPTPIFVGGPAADYPWPWSLVPWIPGDSAAETSDLDLETCAGQLARFLGALHRPAPAEAPPNPFRGVPLAARDEATRGRASGMSDTIDAARAEQIWDAALDLPAHDGGPRWLHGDLHPHNLLVVEGVLSGVVDFGDITAGDPATDLAVAWSFLPLGLHDAFRDEYGGVDEATWGRARGWALSLGLAYLASSGDSPIMERVGRRALAAVLASA